MRNYLFFLCLILVLGVSAPAQAQLRAPSLTERAPARLFDAAGSSFSLNKLFDPAHFKMGQSIEFSASSFGGHSSSLGMYTNSMMWQFNDKLAARVDMSVAYSPNASSFSDPSGGNLGGGRVFLRNAEVAYRPSENVQLHLSIQQNPYGSYASPYGYYGGPRYGRGYGSRSAFSASFGTPDDLFWNDESR